MSDTVITFRLADATGELAAVGLMQDLRRPRDWTPLHKDGDVWTVDFPLPDANRMEYQLKTVRPSGEEAVICDPANPLRVPGAFGDKSVLHLPGYTPPAWIDDDSAPPGDTFRAVLPSLRMRADIEARIWTSAGGDLEQPLPLLIAHDGPEYADYSGLIHFLEHMTAAGRLPPMRAVLLTPPWPRDEHYSASAAYARALVSDVMPALQWLAPMPKDGPGPVAMGASLGALALLHAHRFRSQSFGGLYLQSGSYFRQRYDKQESGFGRFRRVSRFIGEVLNAETIDHAVPTVLTCGTVEENLANNRAVAAALERQGYPVRLVVNRDSHSYVGWRDTFDPHLVDLLTQVWRPR